MTPEEQIAVEEYKELGAFMRHYGNLRFAQLTVFLTLTGALFAASLTGHADRDQLRRLHLGILLPACGLLVTFLFWRIEESATAYFLHYKKRAVVLEAIGAPLAQVAIHPFRRDGLFNATNSTRALFAVFAGAWVYLLVVGH